MRLYLAMMIAILLYLAVEFVMHLYMVEWWSWLLFDDSIGTSDVVE